MYIYIWGKVQQNLYLRIAAAKGEGFVGTTMKMYVKKRKLKRMTDDEWEELEMKAVSTIQLFLSDEVN
jgi:hypothetical protein